MNIHSVTECFNDIKSVSTVIFGLFFRNNQPLSAVLYLNVQFSIHQPELDHDPLLITPAVFGGIQRQFVQGHAGRQAVLPCHGNIGREFSVFRPNRRLKVIRKRDLAGFGFVGMSDSQVFTFCRKP